jgi:hypothetical protein
MPIVRLKLHDPKKGHRLRSLIDSASDGKRYVEGSFYSVTQAEAEHLSWFMQDATREDPRSPVFGQARAFDIFPTKEAADASLEEEMRGQLGVAGTTSKVLVAPGRGDGDNPVLASADVIDSSDALTRPLTALEKRNAAAARATARASSNAKRA